MQSYNRDRRLMFSFDRGGRLIPSISASGSSNLRFYISFRSFRPEFLSILNDRGAVPLWKHISMCMFSFQASASCVLCHRMEREQLLHPAQFTLFKRWPNSACHGLLEEFLFSISRYIIFNTLAIYLLGKFQHFTTVPNLRSWSSLIQNQSRVEWLTLLWGCPLRQLALVVIFCKLFSPIFHCVIRALIPLQRRVISRSIPGNRLYNSQVFVQTWYKLWFLWNICTELPKAKWGLRFRVR